MDQSQFWKNFNLGTELGISGRFIYNGLRAFHEMDTLYHEDEVFEVLYNLAVGLERLLKIAVILIEHDGAADQEAFEESLITHNHVELLARVRKRCEPHLGGIHNQFLQMLSTFYRTHRYGRYASASAFTGGKEKRSLHAFINKHLGIEISNDAIAPTPNDVRIRKLIGKTTGKIATKLYDIIRNEAERLGLFTHELRNPSKAAKIFLNKEYDFTREDVLWRELLIFVMKSERTIGHLGFLRRLEPLGFDPEREIDYLQCFESTEKMLFVTEELDELYDGLERSGERLEAIGLIGNPYVFFEDGEEEGTGDEETEAVE